MIRLKREHTETSKRMFGRGRSFHQSSYISWIWYNLHVVIENVILAKERDLMYSAAANTPSHKTFTPFLTSWRLPSESAWYDLPLSPEERRLVSGIGKVMSAA